MEEIKLIFDVLIIVLLILAYLTVKENTKSNQEKIKALDSHREYMTGFAEALSSKDETKRSKNGQYGQGREF